MSIAAYNAEECVVLQDDDYFFYLEEAIEEARIRLWACIFIADVRVDRDRNLRVRRLLNALKDAAWRNVDVKLLLGTSSIPDIRLAAETTVQFCRQLGLAVHTFNSPRFSSTHSKYVVADHKLAIIGSHNWTQGALNINIETAVAVQSADINRKLAGEFSYNWRTSREAGDED